MLKVVVNEKEIVEIDSQGGATMLNGEVFSWDLVHLSDNRFHILYNNRSYNAEIIEADYTEKTFKIKVNRQLYTLTAKDRFALLLEQMGINNTSKNKVNHLKAPMPGLIWEIKVQVGDIVKTGDVVLILVAMKMENALKSPGEGVVKNIKINQGDSVEKNQLLIEFE
ncbi:MAG: acetyl-CoA carboxylase biotin carboxyl carrier protein subunit [Spirosomataceae bacterium]